MAEIGDEDQAGWDEACRLEAAIRDLLTRYPKRLRISVVEAVAWELGGQLGNPLSADRTLSADRDR